MTNIGKCMLYIMCLILLVSFTPPVAAGNSASYTISVRVPRIVGVNVEEESYQEMEDEEEESKEPEYEEILETRLVKLSIPQCEVTTEEIERDGQTFLLETQVVK
jgi:hypothetical protein